MRNNVIDKAHERYRKAAKAYMEAVVKIYPVGAIVTVNKGRATFRAQVIAHSSAWWAGPGDLHVENINTGKYRSIHVADIIKAGAKR